MNNSVFGKTMEILKKHEDIKLVTTEASSNYLVSEPNYHTTKLLSRDILAINIRKTQTAMISLLIQTDQHQK